MGPGVYGCDSSLISAGKPQSLDVKPSTDAHHRELPFAHKEEAFFYPAEAEPTMAGNMVDFLPDLRDRVCLPMSCRELVPTPDEVELVQGLRDDNRCLLLPDHSAVIDGRRYFLEVKGIGARVPMYGFMMPDDPTYVWGQRANGRGLTEHWRTMLAGEPRYTGEMWFGNAPYGAHGTSESRDSVAITELGTDPDNPNCLNGFWFCPVLYSIELPKWVVGPRQKVHWYRRFQDSWSQQFRLMPSNVRLYFHSEYTMGQAPAKVLKSFGVSSEEELDSFIENYIRSGTAALTLAARTCRVADGGGFQVLDYDDVWLDKDSVIAPDGTLHFADIDDLDWRSLPDEEAVREKFRKQLERNFFEFMFSLDALVSEAYLQKKRNVRPDQRRYDVAARFEMALMMDEFARPELAEKGLDLLVEAPGVIDEPTRIRLIDF